MREAIQRVIQSEVEAKQLLAQARAEADRILSGARKQAQDLTTSASQAANTEARRILELAAQESESTKQQKLNEAIAAIDREIRLDPTLEEKLIHCAVLCICGLPQENPESHA